MRTSLNDIREAESFLTNEMGKEESLVFQAKMIINPLLRMNVILQKGLMDVVRLYHRRILKQNLKTIHHKLLTSSEKTEFQKLIRSIFHP